jgi:hypothetical protein
MTAYLDLGTSPLNSPLLLDYFPFSFKLGPPLDHAGNLKIFYGGEIISSFYRYMVDNAEVEGG